MPQTTKIYFLTVLEVGKAKFVVLAGFGFWQGRSCAAGGRLRAVSSHGEGEWEGEMAASLPRPQSHWIQALYVRPHLTLTSWRLWFPGTVTMGVRASTGIWGAGDTAVCSTTPCRCSVLCLSIHQVLNIWLVSNFSFKELYQDIIHVSTILLVYS